jgi:hypothetical protein
MISTKRGRAGLLAVAASTLALGGVVGTAGASSAASAEPAPVTTQADAGVAKAKGYAVTTWHRANVRACASTKCKKETEVKANKTYVANCWAKGQKVHYGKYTNNVWLAIRYTNGDHGWASAIYFKGNKYANLPAKARC